MGQLGLTEIVQPFVDVGDQVRQLRDELAGFAA
jgi:hypothetical protein